MKRQLLVAILLAFLVSAKSFGQTPQGTDLRRMQQTPQGADLRRIQQTPQGRIGLASPSTSQVADLRRIPFSRLSLEEQAKLRSAHDTAMRDPGLIQSRARYEQARKEFRDKLRDALLKADPSVQSILEKAQRQQHRDR
jgi:hypothetical protein